MCTNGRYNESNYPVQELWRKRGGGHIFEGGVLTGHYGISIYCMSALSLHIDSTESMMLPWTQLVMYLAYSVLQAKRVHFGFCDKLVYNFKNN